jgi:hypothetical protein
MLACALLASPPPALPADVEGEADAPSRVVEHGGRISVRLSAAWQKQAGIEVYAPELLAIAPENPAIGRVVDLQPLFDLRSRYHQARADLDIARAALRSSVLSLERLQMLHGEAANVSARQLQEAQARRDSEKARSEAAAARLQDLEFRALQDWGNVITGWILAAESAALSSLSRREQVLVQLTLGADQSLPADVTRVHLARGGDRAAAAAAELVSPAPRTPEGVQGETWFFRMPAGDLRVGMRLQAWVPAGGAASTGIRLPAAAVIWHAGRPWAYERQDGEYFARRELAGARSEGDGYFVPDASLAGIEIVSAGAQTLLSEEFRGRIPDEDDDP